MTPAGIAELLAGAMTAFESWSFARDLVRSLVTPTQPEIGSVAWDQDAQNHAALVLYTRRLALAQLLAPHHIDRGRATPNATA
jgi:hypothetical protein